MVTLTYAPNNSGLLISSALFIDKQEAKNFEKYCNHNRTRAMIADLSTKFKDVVFHMTKVQSGMYKTIMELVVEQVDENEVEEFGKLHEKVLEFIAEMAADENTSVTQNADNNEEEEADINFENIIGKMREECFFEALQSLFKVFVALNLLYEEACNEQ